MGVSKVPENMVENEEDNHPLNSSLDNPLMNQTNLETIQSKEDFMAALPLSPDSKLRTPTPSPFVLNTIAKTPDLENKKASTPNSGEKKPKKRYIKKKDRPGFQTPDSKPLDLQKKKEENAKENVVKEPLKGSHEPVILTPAKRGRPRKYV